MGGFEIANYALADSLATRPTASENPEFPADREYMTVTPCGAALLARLGLLPEVSVDTIKDKSKADALTKLVVCFQGSWVLIQAVGRKVKGFPITLLEVNTMMHMVCALFMYLLWFMKPQNVEIPTKIEDEHPAKPLYAMLSIKSIHHLRNIESGPKDSYIVNVAEKEKFSGTQLVPVSQNGGSQPDMITGTPDTHNNACNQTDFQIPRSSSSSILPELKKCNYRLSWKKGVLEYNSPEKSWSARKFDHEQMKEIIQVDYFEIQYTDDTSCVLIFRGALDKFQCKTRMTMQSAHFLIDYATRKDAAFGETDINWTTFCEEIRRNGNFGCTKEIRNLNVYPLEAWGDIMSDRFIVAQVAIASFSLITPLYAGVHLAPWNSHFPTYLERYLWRLSGLYLIGTSPITPGIRWFRRSYRNPDGRLHVFFWVLGFINIILVVLSRVYLQVEAFASLRSLPAGSYKTVSWVELWPHF